MTGPLFALAGVAAMHVVGAVLSALLTRGGLRAALRSPSSAWVCLAVLYPLSLGVEGLVLLALFAGAALWLRPKHAAAPAVPWLWLAALAALVLARPWVPTMWDELVWLGKARLGSLGFAHAVSASLDPKQALIPAGYPPLWPAAVGWLSLGRDALDAQVVAGSLLTLLAAAAALEAWLPRLREPGAVWPLALGVGFGAPLLLVHLRSTYVDLPVGLLGAALLGHLLTALESQPATLAPAALALAVVLPGLKDEGLVHALAATAAAAWVGGRRAGAWRTWAPGALALCAAATWRLLSRTHGVEDTDHALGAPYWAWTPQLFSLLLLHATELSSWGVFWPVALGVLTLAPATPELRALRTMLGLCALGFAVALLFGPERVRVFAENGTLLNRLLIQAWPVAAVALWLGATAPPSAARAARAPASS